MSLPDRKPAKRAGSHSASASISVAARRARRNTFAPLKLSKAAGFGNSMGRNPNRDIGQDLDEDTAQAPMTKVGPSCLVASDPEEPLDALDLLLNQNTFDTRIRLLCFYGREHFIVGFCTLSTVLLIRPGARRTRFCADIDRYYFEDKG